MRRQTKRDEKRLVRMMREAGSPEAAGSGLIDRLLALEAAVSELEQQAQVVSDSVENESEPQDEVRANAPATD